ncbi:MAG: GTP cyclohydrolase [Bacteroidia bacterium]|nr:GTP cyclohydrolase [Bacteroidia bacterium]
MIVQLAEGSLRTRYGTWREILFYDGQRESIALVMGDIAGAEDLLCRVHSSCIFGHYFNSVECDCQQQMDMSQQLIEQQGRGIVILLDQEGKGNGHFALLNSVAFKRAGMKQADAYEAAGFSRDARDFTSAGKILHALGVSSIRMLTNNPDKVNTVTKHGVRVTGTMEIGEKL